MSDDLKLVRLVPEPITKAGFAPFGQVMAPIEDGVLFGPDDAQLVLDQGTPRFYVMRLYQRGLVFRRVTRHAQVTQCLAALGGHDWLLGVCAPIDPDDPAEKPDPTRVRAFSIPGNVAVKLHRGTWHAGPYFQAAQIDFANLELSDTNDVDHDSCEFDKEYGLSFEFKV
jgi:ureidoglycolate hydrolase